MHCCVASADVLLNKCVVMIVVSLLDCKGNNLNKQQQGKVWRRFSQSPDSAHKSVSCFFYSIITNTMDI